MRVLVAAMAMAIGCSDGVAPAADAATVDARDASPVDVPPTDVPKAFCARDPRVQSPAGSLERRGERLIVRREAVTPAGTGRALYTWTVTLRTDAGPLPDDATLTASPRMPEHGHGARRAPGVRALGNGRFEISELDLFMDGVWTVTLRASFAGATDTVVFGVCIG